MGTLRRGDRTTEVRENNAIYGCDVAREKRVTEAHLVPGVIDQRIPGSRQLISPAKGE